MKIQHKGFDDLIYILACIFSFGTVWLARIIISEGIRCGLEDK